MLGWMWVWVLVGRWQIGVWRTHDQLAVLHTFDADQAIGQFLYLSEPALDHHDFQAHIMVKVGMYGGDDDFVILVLQLHQLLRQKPGVMIVNESHGAHDQRLGR